MINAHIIKSQVYDVNFASEAKATAIQSKISQLNANQIQSDLNALLDKWERVLGTIQIEKLEINLGSIEESKLNQRLPERIKEELNSYFEELARNQADESKKASAKPINDIDRKLSILDYFLRTGTYPWWAKQQNTIGVEALVNDLLTKNKDDLSALLRRFSHSSSAIARLVSHLSDGLIFKLIRNLRPSEARVIIEIGKDTIKVHEKRKVINASQRVFRNKVWQFILTYLLNERGSYFNTKEFVSSLLAGIAQYFNISYTEILAHFHPAILNLQKELQLKHNLAGIVESLYQEENLNQSTNNKNQKREKSQKKYSERELNTLLKFGAQNVDQKTDKEWSEIVTQVLASKNQKLIRKLQLKITDTAFEDRIGHLKLAEKPKKDLEKLISNSTIHTDRIKLESEAVKNFLSTGSLRYAEAGLSLNLLVKRLILDIKHKSDSLRKVILSEGKRQVVRKRLIENLEEDHIKRLVVLIEPTGAEFINQFADHLQASKEQDKLKISTDKGSFVKLKWEFILSALLVDRGSKFNQKTFVRMAIDNMAAHLNLSKETFFQQAILQLSFNQKSSISANLSIVLNELQTEEYIALKKRRIESRKRSENRVKIEWIKFVISKNSNPWWAAEFDLKIEDFGKVLEELPHSYQKDLKTFFTQNLRHKTKRKFILNLLTNEQHISTIGLIKPVAKNDIVALAKLFDQLGKIESVVETRFINDKWDVLFQIISKQKGTGLNLQKVIFESLTKLSNHFNLSFEELLQSFILFGAKSKSAELKNIIDQIELEGLKKGKLVPRNPQIIAKIKDEDISEWIKKYSRGEGLSKWQMEVLEQRLIESIKSKSKRQLEALLLKTNISNTQWQNLVEQLSIKSKEQELILEKTLGFIQPEKRQDSSPIKAFADLLKAARSNPFWSFTFKKQIDSFFTGNTSVKGQNFKDAITHLNFSKEDLTLLLGQLDQRSQRIILDTLYTNDTRFINEYNCDILLMIRGITHLSDNKILQLLNAFSIDYLVSSKHFNKHLYFEKALRHLMQKLNISTTEIKTHVGKTLASQKEKFISTAPLSWARLKQNEEIKRAEESRSEVKNLSPEDEIPIEKKQEEPIELEDQMSVSNCGLVILWPYLQQYFSMLDLLEGEQFKNDESANRAALLLEYLVTGQTNFEEHELLLNKLLCGIDPLNAIDVQIELTDQEKEISESLLNGVIQNWPKMEETSIEALRETFLIRDGLIQILDEQIELRVEKKTLDILMDTIPWAYSIIKFSWIEKAIHVLW